MAIGGIHLWSISWRQSWRLFLPRREGTGCPHSRPRWQNLRARNHSVLLEGKRLCVDECLEPVLTHALEHAAPAARRMPSHRIPLGLLLLSRQQITQDQLHTALEAQLTAGRGRIGEWLQSMGFVSAEQVTAALARQWSCPVLRGNLPPSPARPGPAIPLALLQECCMVPLSYVESASRLHVAFGDAIDYTVLYAIEQMMGCHTEPCMAIPSFVKSCLDHLASHHKETGFVFDRMNDAAEFSRIVRSYCGRVSASEVRLAHCGSFHWVRLIRTSRSPIDLLMRRRQPGFPAFS
jgi:hypothetical protein